MCRVRTRLAGAVALAGSIAALVSPAAATFDYGPLRLSGNLETQTLVRHAAIDELQFVQNRNSFRLRAEWDWLEDGRWLQRFELPFVDSSRVVLLYRGVYDSFYDIAPGGRQLGQTRFDDIVGGRIGDLSRAQRDNAKFENDLREAYVDLKLSDLPLRFRLGRQQVVWGEADQFRLMDIWNPIDVRWHFQQEASWDEIRVPLWLAKGVWDVGAVGPLRDVFLEVVYNPGDFHPGIKADFLPRPWALPFPDPLRGAQVQEFSGTHVTPMFDLQGTSYRQGDFHRNPAEASEVGMRWHGVVPGGIEVTANYLYGRSRGIGAASPFAVKIESLNFARSPIEIEPIGRYQKNAADPIVDLDLPCTQNEHTICVLPIDVRARVVHPYVHIFGLTANYFDDAFTQTAFRLETAYALGEPFQTTDAATRVPVTITNPRTGAEVPFPQFGRSPLGFTKRDVWAGMLGFDRATWIPALNRESSWFFSGQFFWSQTLGGGIGELRGNSGIGDAPYFGAVGRWVSGPYTGKLERQQDAVTGGNGDAIKRWELLFTLAATSFYYNGKIIPLVGNVFDPVNLSDEILWSIDYFYNSNFFITLQQKFFTDFGATVPVNDPWFAGGRFHRRDETALKLTYQF